MTVTISSGFTPGDVLAADASGTLLTADYDTSTHALTISGTGTLLDYQTVLRRVTFDNPEDAGNPLAGHNPTNFGASTSRIVTFVADDGSVDSADVDHDHRCVRDQRDTRAQWNTEQHYFQ